MSNVSRDFANAIVEWVRELEPALADGVPYLDVEAPVLPGVVAQLTDWGRTASGDDERFPMQSIQQVWVTAYTFDVVIVVDNGDPDEADAFLKDVAEKMAGSAFADSTLGGRVPTTSRQMNADFELPFVQWQSGTWGRQAVVTMHVANPMKEEW